MKHRTLSLTISIVFAALFPSFGVAQNVTTEKEKAQVIELTTESFKQRVMDYEKHPQEWVYAGKRPSIIDFYATWCGPCKQVAPIMAQLANDYAGKIDIYKVDIDKNRELAALFGIQSIPTILFIPNEGLPQKAVGAMPKSSYEEAIKKLLVTP